VDLTTFILSLAAGGVLVGVLIAMFLPRIASGGVLPAAFLCAIFAVIGGFVVTDLLELEYSVGGPLVLALTPLYAFVVSRSDGDGYSSPWSGGDSGSGDCGGGDSGGGGDCGGGGD
jgi:uncharacterized membrane protein YgcG